MVSCHLLHVDGEGGLAGKGDYKVSIYNPKFIDNKVYINSNQYLYGLSQDVWKYKIGGYQVVSKWIKSRYKKVLNQNDTLIISKIIKSLQSTISLQVKIDDLINHSGEWNWN